MSTDSAKSAGGYPEDPFLFEKIDIWASCILPFVGPGHYLHVAAGSHCFKQLYLDFFSTLKDPPLVQHRKFGERIQAIATNTFYQVAFETVPTTEHWDAITKEQEGRRLRRDLVCQRVASYGNLHILKWAHQKGFPWDKWTCAYAAANGHLEVLKWAHKKGCPWNEQACSNAAGNGHLGVIKWLHEQGCEWNTQTCDRAAKNGHLKVLKYAHEQGCGWSWMTCAWAARGGIWKC